jgi:hypothetical protein
LNCLLIITDLAMAVSRILTCAGINVIIQPQQEEQT